MGKVIGFTLFAYFIAVQYLGKDKITEQFRTMVETISKINLLYFGQEPSEEQQRKHDNFRSRIVSALKFIAAPIIVQDVDEVDPGERITVTSLWRFFDNICKNTMFQNWLDPNAQDFYQKVNRYTDKDLLFGVLPQMYIDPATY